jgi:uncharacterized protein (DUF433 family)
METPLVNRNTDIMGGALCFNCTRVPAENLLDCLESASTLEYFVADFPSVPRAHLIAVLKQARERLSVEAPTA